MVSNYKLHEVAESFEHAVTVYLRACGYRTFGESLNYTQRGAPIARGQGRGDSYATADIAAMKDGNVSFFEVKWKSKTFPAKYGDRRLTGIDQDAYAAYLKHERDSGCAVVIVFCHQKEDEVRCATLAQLKAIESHRCTQQQYPDSKGGMINWFFDQIPLWMPYETLRSLADDFRKSGNATAPPEIVLPQPEVQVPMFDARWKGEAPKPAQQSFLITEVEVLDLDRGSGGRRRGRSH